MHVAKVVSALIDNKAHKATKFVDAKSVVRATAVLVRGKVRRGNAHIVLTIGRPNYAERKFIQACQKAGEPFPVKRIQLKYPPKRR